MSDQFDDARGWMETFHAVSFDPDAKKDSLVPDALAGIAHALIGIGQELRRLNDGRDAFHREVLDLLSKATEDPFEAPPQDGSLRSGQPVAAPDGQEGGKP